MKKYSLVGSLVLAGALLFNPISSDAKDFNDVWTDLSHGKAAEYFNDLGVYDYKEGSFLQAKNDVTRGEVSKILYNLYHDELDKVRSYSGNFTDISKNKFSKEITWSYEVGIFDGGTGGKFNPNNSLTRAQMSKILVNTFNLQNKGNSSFKDVSSSHWAKDYIATLATNGVTTGDGKGNYMPEKNVTLYQFSTFLYRIVMMEKAPVTVKPVEDVKKPVVEETKPVVEEAKSLGAPSAHSEVLQSEYDFNWHVVKTGKDLELEGVKDGKVVALYKTANGSSVDGNPDLKIGSSTKQDVEAKLGTVTKTVKKGTSVYSLGAYNGKTHSIYKLEDKYNVVFYDSLNKDVIRSILVLTEDQTFSIFVSDYDVNTLKSSTESTETLMIMLLNQFRESKGSKPLTNTNAQWGHVARNHSLDMATNNFYSHENLQGMSSGDRMRAAGVASGGTTENISSSYLGLIFANESLINSTNHRKSMLNSGYKNVYGGAAYNNEGRAYYTLNYY